MKKVFQGLLKYGVPVVIGFGLFYFLYHNVDLQQMKKVLESDVQYWWFIPVAVVSVFSHIFRALRWKLQLDSMNIHAPVSALVNSIFGTYAVNLVFPRLGEVWRSGYIASRQKAPFTKVFGSMVSERLCDTATVFLLLLFSMIVAGPAFERFFNTYPQVQQGLVNLATNPLVWAAVAAVIAFLVWLFKSNSQNSVVLKVRGMVANLWAGFASVGQMEKKWQFLIYTVLLWGCYFMQLYIATFAFSFTQDLGVVAVLVLFVLSSIGMGVPTNGGLGAWHIAIIFGLSLYGVGVFNTNSLDPQASAFAMMVWGFQTLLLIVLGIYAFAYISLEKKEK